MLLTLANPSLTRLRAISIFGISKSRLGNIFLNASGVDVTKRTSLVKDKNIRWLSLSLLEADNRYFLGALVSNQLGLSLTILDSKSSHFGVL